MRTSSAALILTVAATAAPAFAVPVSPSSFSRRQTTAVPDDSDAISLGTLGTIFSLGAPVVSGIIDHFKNNGQQSRELAELFARAEVDASGALKLGDAADIASIGSSVVSVFHNLFGGSSQQQRRDLLELVARQLVEPTVANQNGQLRQASSTGGGGLGQSSGGSGGLGQSSGGSGGLGQGSNSGGGGGGLGQSGGLSLGTLGTIFSLGAPVVSGIIDHFKNNGQQSRELAELFARAEVDASGALKLGDAADIASIGSSVVSVFHNLFGGGNQQQRRDLLELVARQLVEPAVANQNGQLRQASSTGGGGLGQSSGGSGGLGQSSGGGLGQGSNSGGSGGGLGQSGGLSLGTLGTIFSLGAPVVSGLIDHFKNNGQQQQRREMEDIVARASTISPSTVSFAGLHPNTFGASLNDLD